MLKGSSAFLGACSSLFRGTGAFEKRYEIGTHLVRARDVGESLLKVCVVSAATSSQQVIVAGVECNAIFSSRELVCIVAEKGLLTRKEIVGRRVGRRVLDVCLGCAAMERLTKSSCNPTQGN